MKAVIELDVPEWQIGQNVTVYFPDTMVKQCKCELLKEQEAVKPVFECEEPTLKIGQFHCGNCHQSFGISHYRFCPFCGKPVQWE